MGFRAAFRRFSPCVLALCVTAAGCAARRAALPPPEPAGSPSPPPRSAAGELPPRPGGSPTGPPPEGKTPGPVEPVPSPVPGPEPEGVFHPLQRGQTLHSLSRSYGVPVSTLMRVNGIQDPTRIPAGTPIFVPGARQAVALPALVPPALAWPASGRVTSRFGPRGRRSRHTGIDIDGILGQRIRAAADGVVVKSGSASGYGLRVVLDHGGGLRTMYAHASRVLVLPGERVKRGDPIAKIGGSGNARGTHLHFEVLLNGRPVDPLPYLDGR